MVFKYAASDLHTILSQKRWRFNHHRLTCRVFVAVANTRWMNVKIFSSGCMTPGRLLLYHVLPTLLHNFRSLVRVDRSLRSLKECSVISRLQPSVRLCYRVLSSWRKISNLNVCVRVFVVVINRSTTNGSWFLAGTLKTGWQGPVVPWYRHTCFTKQFAT